MKAILDGKVVSQKESGTHIVMESGPTHYGIDSAKELALMAKEAGADSVKYQLLYPDRLMSDKDIKFGYQYLEIDKAGNETFVPVEEPLYDILKRRELTEAEWLELKAYCDQIGIHMFTTATYKEEVDFIVDKLKVDSIKLNSGDVNELELIRYCASKGVNLQLDTGNASLWEIERAVIEAEQAGCENIIIHHCPSGYPAHLESIHLRNITTLKQMFPHYAIAFSDHSPGGDMDIAAVALGADMVEKTITLDRTIKSCEHSFSLEKKAANQFVESIRAVEVALGAPRRTIPADIQEKRRIGRRSPYSIKSLSAGTVIQAEDFDFKRPGFGITSEEFQYFIGKILKKDLSDNERLTYDCI